MESCPDCPEGKRRRGTDKDPCICVKVLSVGLEFPDADIEDYDEETMIQSLAKALGVAPESIVILSVKAGSILVDFVVLPPVDETDFEEDSQAFFERMVSMGLLEVENFGEAVVTAFDLPPQESSDAVFLGMNLIEIAIAGGLSFIVSIFLAVYWRRSKSKVSFLQGKVVEADHHLVDNGMPPYSQDPEGGMYGMMGMPPPPQQSWPPQQQQSWGYPQGAPPQYPV